METGWTWLLISTLCFLGGFAYVAISLRTGRYHPSPLNLCIMAVGFVAQCLFLGERGQAVGRCPITNPFEILVFVSWSAVLLYFVLGRAFRLSLMGAFTAPLVSFFQLVSLPFLRDVPEYRPADDYWLEMHASISLLAYGAFALACIAGVMFLVQDSLLKRAKLQELSYNLPPVTNLSKAITRLVGIGLALLTVGIASGFGTKTPPTGIHLFLSVCVWAAYAILIGLRFTRGLSSRLSARLSLGVFILPVITLMMLDH
ncbi:MAG: cytochrome c biogenesis protein CcsA [Verrucomicrobiota bacterium]